MEIVREDNALSSPNRAQRINTLCNVGRKMEKTGKSQGLKRSRLLGQSESHIKWIILAISITPALVLPTIALPGLMITFLSRALLSFFTT